MKPSRSRAAQCVTNLLLNLLNNAVSCLAGIDGSEVVRHSLNMLRECKPLLIAISGSGQEYERERLRLAGFDQHPVRLVSHTELSMIVSRARAFPEAEQRSSREAVP
jgi:hypothetical protein